MRRFIGASLRIWGASAPSNRRVFRIGPALPKSSWDTAVPRRRHRHALTALAALALAAVVPAATARAGSPGTVRFAKSADSGFDAYTRAPTDAERVFMRTHYWRLRA